MKKKLNINKKIKQNLNSVILINFLNNLKYLIILKQDKKLSGAKMCAKAFLKLYQKKIANKLEVSVALSQREYKYPITFLSFNSKEKFKLYALELKNKKIFNTVFFIKQGYYLFENILNFNLFLLSNILQNLNKFFRLKSYIGGVFKKIK